MEARMLSQTHADIVPYSMNVLEGTRDAKIQYLVNENSDARKLTIGVLTAEGPSTVRSRLRGDEAVYIIDGTAVVRIDDGPTIGLVAGDSLFLPKGTQCTWEIPGPMKEFFALGD